MLWVREKRLPNGKWAPDIGEAMCLTGTWEDAQALFGDDDDREEVEVRVRAYRRIAKE